MQREKEYSKVLSGMSQLGPYPMEKLKRIDKPTTLVTDDIKRFDEREMAFARMRRGDFGPAVSSGLTMAGTGSAISMALMSALNLVGAPGGMPPFSPFMAGQQPSIPPMPGMPNVPEMTENVPSPSGVEGMGDMPARMRQMMAVMSSEPAPEKTALPDDPAIVSRHIKSVGYFVGADVVGICELPQWAV